MTDRRKNKRNADTSGKERFRHSRPHPDRTGDCFLTSACTEARGLPDDCEELTVLRRFRDEILLKQPGGHLIVYDYYSIAPAVIHSINCGVNPDEVWERVYNEMVLPCVSYIKEERYREALSLYSLYTLQLAEERGVLIPEEEAEALGLITGEII